MKQEYVVGLLFSNDRSKVALIEKTHPDWQRGRLNGIGGKVEEGETPVSAVHREFLEEAGANVWDWRYFCELNHQGRIIHYLTARQDCTISSVTDEKVGWYPVSGVHQLKLISNLLWLIPMGLDKDRVTAIVADNS